MADDETGITGENSGLKTAVAEAHDPETDLPDEDGAEQLDLLPLSQPDSGKDAQKKGIQSKGPGRPPGARNKSTEAWQQYLLSKYPSPVEGLMATYSRPVADLARELGCSRYRAFQIQQKAMETVAPYVHKKQPMAIENNGNELIPLVIQAGNFNTGDGDQQPQQGMQILDNNIQQNQQLTEGENANSVNAGSVEDSQASENEHKSESDTTDQ
jgi:hypothetical protein